MFKDTKTVEEIRLPQRSVSKKATVMAFNESRLGAFESLKGLKEAISKHPVLVEMAKGQLPIATFQQTLTNFFPLVENFPKFMALNLAKIRCDKSGHDAAKNWLIGNIKIERNHSNWYIDWAEGFGVSKAHLLSGTGRTAASQAIVQHLWTVNHNQSVSTCFAATNVGVEWATGEWAWMVRDGVESYLKRGIATGATKKVMTWLNAHASYDDTHPYEAMELVVKCAESNEDIETAVSTAKRTLEYYLLAFDDCGKTIH